MSDLFPVEPSFPSPLEKARREHDAAVIAYENADPRLREALKLEVQKAERVVRAMEAARLAR